MRAHHRLVQPANPSFRSRSVLAAFLMLALAACDDDDPPPPLPVAAEPPFGANDVLPGVVIGVEGVRGGTGPGGNVRAGDRLTVDFTVNTSGGQPLELTTMARGSAMVSGPTSNYQRVIAAQSDVLTASVKRDLAKFSYTFALPIPSTYLAPINDTAALTEGELTGQPLLSGTYTIGLELRKDYTLDDETFRDPGNATVDFLFGDATAGAVTVGVEYVTFSDVQENRLLTPMLIIALVRFGIRKDMLASTAPNVGMTPELTPDLK